MVARPVQRSGDAHHGSLDALSPTFVANGNDSTISDTAIQAALDAGQNVIIDTGSSGAQAGDITVARPIAKTAGGDASLTLRAADNIYLSAVGITSSSGALSVTLNSDTDGASGGAVWLQSGSSIVTNGGSLTIGGGANPLTTASRASGDILGGRKDSEEPRSIPAPAPSRSGARVPAPAC